VIKPKPEILATPSAHHGAFDYDELAQLNFAPDEVIDFSVNSNPYGPPPSVRQSIANVPLDRYPDRECIALRQKLAEKHHVGIENIVVGNGTAEIMILIAMAFIKRGDNVIQISPAFTEYERIAKLMGGNVTNFYTQPHNQFDIDLPSLEQQIQDTKPTAIFFSNPNNPSGQAYASPYLHRIFQEFPNTLIVSDEAYTQFRLGLIAGTEMYHVYSKYTTDEQLQIAGMMRIRNILSLRSLTKDFAIAGLRLGYAIGHPDLIEAIRLIRPAWNVNALAQAAGLAVLDEMDWLRDTVRQLHDDKNQLVDGLHELGLKPLPSLVHYFLVNVGNATEFRSKLLRHKIMVRDCTSFGLPEYVRISTRTPADNQKLLKAIETCL